MSKLRDAGKQLGDLVDGERDGAYNHAATEGRLAAAVMMLASAMVKRPVATAYFLAFLALGVLVLIALALALT